MKKIIFILFFTFLSTELFAYKTCGIHQEYWKTGGISYWTFSPQVEILHIVKPRENNVGAIGYGCSESDSPQSRPDNLPSWVGYDTENLSQDKPYPYKCLKNTESWIDVFEGAFGEGFYSCTSGLPNLIPNAESINPNDEDNPVTCSEGFELSFDNGFAIDKSKPSSLRPYTDYSCQPSNISSPNEYYYNNEKKETLLQEPVSYSNPDGSSTLLLPDGTKQTVYPTGVIQIEYPNGEIVTGQLKSPTVQNGDYIKYQGQNNSGDKIWKMQDDTVYLLEPNGDLTTIKPDNTVKLEHNVPNDWKPSQNYGYSSNINGGTVGTGTGTGTGGSSGGTGSGTSQGKTSNDDKTDEEIAEEEEEVPEEEPNTSCSDSKLTVQEKLLCEVNHGIKKINSESNPDYSLNNIINKLKTESNINETGIKDTTANISYNLNTSISNDKKLSNNLTKSSETINIQNEKLNSLNQTLRDINTNLTNNVNTPGGGSTPNSNLDEYLNSDSTVNTDNITNNANQTDSKIDNLISIYSNFASNIQNSTAVIIGQINSTKSLITGVNNIFQKEKITTCPISYSFDLSSYDSGNKIIDFDICKYFSQLNTLGYFVVYVALMFVLIISTITILGVLSK
ncbi:hypothetical protein ACIB15232_0946 [Aliarcobacter cibarius]|uniref:T-complex 10 C-terminal domain-containing protein n=1 Tax=Aliarcobacter cibarius TaxID=255507 RepID=UPI0012465449|nr:T-complex 10 C-terminal domain-containing protein [Aliarcobacter cibarius]QEZ89064.1 hypothetical protein ACIB15232_0946 [Aliarcobacter cibarius]